MCSFGVAYLFLSSLAIFLFHRWPRQLIRSGPNVCCVPVLISGNAVRVGSRGQLRIRSLDWCHLISPDPDLGLREPEEPNYLNFNGVIDFYFHSLNKYYNNSYCRHVKAVYCSACCFDLARKRHWFLSHFFEFCPKKKNSRCTLASAYFERVLTLTTTFKLFDIK